MRLEATFQESKQTFAANFTAAHIISDGGYERGYAAGYEKGRIDFSVPTQEKTVDIIANGAVSVTPDEGYVLSKVTANVNVPTSGGGREIIDALIDRSITEISSDITIIGYHAFDNCDKLVSASFPNVTSISGYGFQNCSSLKNVSMPKLQGLNGYAFYGCTSLENVDFPSIRSIANYAFRKCAALKKFDLQQTYNINVYAFYECSNLETIILRKTDQPCTLAATNALQQTKIANGEGYIYVPSALVEQYKAASIWSAYAKQIRAIEDYPDICG